MKVFFFHFFFPILLSGRGLPVDIVGLLISVFMYVTYYTFRISKIIK